MVRLTFGLLLAALVWTAGGEFVRAQPPQSLLPPVPSGSAESTLPPLATTPSPPWLLPGFGQPPQGEPVAPPFTGDDPLLEPLVAPWGWFADAEVDVVKVHLKNRLVGNVTRTDGQTDTILATGADHLDWTAGPLFSLGYRIPDGFGEFLATYRGLATNGQRSEGGEQLRSRLDFNVVDFDYANRLDMLPSLWEMRWTVGVRLTVLYFDSRTELAVPDSLGGGSSDQRFSNHYLGAGPHVGLELLRRFGASGLALYSQLEGAYTWGHIGQTFSELVPTGTPLGTVGGVAHDTITQGVGIVGVRSGLRWTPPAYPALQCYLGYQFEYWSQAGRDDNTGSRGEFTENGFFLRADFHF
jgi:hypothetical protein